MKPISALNISTPTLCIVLSAAAALSVSARTVYDAGKALRENFQNNATPQNPYTDSNGGKWTYSSSAGVVPFTSLGDFKSSYATVDNGQLQGWGGASSPHLKVNITDHPLTSSTFIVNGEAIDVNEMMFHPGQTGNSYMVLRFIVPADGWYSAFSSFHDTSKETSTTASSGATVHITQGGNNILAHGIVSLEGVTGSTKRFDFQMPVRYLTKDTEIRFAVGNNAGASGTPHASDATGVKVFVVKEDEGSFYDSGIAMTNNFQSVTIQNPYGNIKDGTWYYLTATIPSEVDFPVWAPTNFSSKLGRITTKVTSGAGNLKGVANSASCQSPFVLVNPTALENNSIAPGELRVHPNARELNKWTAVRFRPPESGRYSASIVVRDTDLGTDAANDEADVYLLVNDCVVTNASVSLENHSSTAHFTLDSRLIVAGEPVDIVVAPHKNGSFDATAVSVIIRRESGDVYDAGKAFFCDHTNGGRGCAFDDLIGGGSTWTVGAKTNAWCGAQFYEGLTSGGVAQNLWWWLQGRFQSYTDYPYFLMATGGVVTADNTFGVSSGLLAATPHEFVAIPNDPEYQSSSPTLKATVVNDGIYRARTRIRDLNNGGGDGVQASVVANGHVVAVSAVINGSSVYEAGLAAERLWLRSGERIEYVVDPLASRTADPTGLSACYERDVDAADAPHVINIDITGSDDNYVGVGREGWSNWTVWNKIRFSSKFPAASERTKANCREADGTTHRNVSFTLKRDSGVDIDKGWSPTGYTGPALLRIWAKSTGPSDTYTFTLSKLKKNEPYTLYLYSSKGMDASGSAVDGNAVFTVGGVTKSADEMWNLRDAKVLTRFEVTSDANGEISGTFAAGSADTSSLVDSLKGGAFNGLTLVGQFPDYIPVGTSVILR